MAKLFLYYSLTGNGDFFAPIMEKKGYDVRKVTEKAKMPKAFFFRVLTGGFRAGLGLKGKLVDYDPDVSNYGEIVIGSPVWNGRFPPAVNSILAQTDLSGKKLTFLFYSGSGDMPKVQKKIAKTYPEAAILLLKEPKSHEGEIEKLASL